jgi:hypothetical protein
VYLAGGAWTYRTSSTGFFTFNDANGCKFYACPSGTAGAAATITQMLTFVAPYVNISNVPMIIAAPGSLPAPVQGSMGNGTLTFVHNSATNLQISMRCSDGIQRSVNLTLS